MTFRVELGTGWALLRLSGEIDAGWVHDQQEQLAKFLRSARRWWS